MRSISSLIRIAITLFTLYLLSTAVFAQTTYTWNGGAGSWDDPLKWTPNGIPGAGDTAAVNSGAITLAANVNSGGLTLNGGILNGNGDLTISGIFRWNGGRLEITGTTRVVQNGFLKIDGSSTKELNHGVLINEGSAAWDGEGKIGLRNSAQFQNAAGASLEIRNAANIDYFSPGGGTLSNSGMLLKSAGNSNVIDVHYAGEGLMTINSGKIILKRSSSLSAAITVAGNCELEFSGGTHAISGVSFLGEGAVEIINASVTVDSGGATFAPGLYLEMKESNSTLTIEGAIAVNGTFDWNRGNIGGASTLAVQGLLKITGENSRKLDGITLQNNNVADWSGTGSIRLLNGAVIHNNSGSAFEIERDVTIDYLEPGGGSFINSGTLTKSDGNGTLLFKVYFENHEILNIEEGTVQLTRGGLSAGAIYNVDNGSLLDFNGGTQTLNDVTFSGGGSVRFSKDMIIVANGGATIHSGVSAAMSAATLDCNAHLANNGIFSWTSGGISGPGELTNHGEFHFAGTNFVDLNALTLINEGLMTWSQGGAIKLKNSAQILNQPGATFDIQGDGLLDYVLANNGGSFSNAGTLTKSGGSGISYIDAVFTNTGAVNAHSGVLRFERGSGTASSGEFNSSAGNTLAFSERTFILNNAVFSGEGTIRLEDAALNVSGTGLAIQPSLTFSLENTLSLLDGDGPIYSNGDFNWARGTISGSGELHVGGSLHINSEYSKILNGKTLSNLGSITWNGPGYISLGNNAQIINQPGATIDIQNNSSMIFIEPFGGVIHNSGTLKKSNSPGSSSLGVDYYNTGVTEVLSGVLKFTKLFSNENSGDIRGSGTLDLAAAIFSNAGAVSPGASPGSLAIAGNYSQNVSGKLNVELAGYIPGLEYDQLFVSGTASLDGILNISLLGSFDPPEGEEFVILNSDSFNGQFNEVNGPAIGGYPVFEINYENNQVVLTVVRQNLSITAVNDYATTEEEAPTSLNVLRNDNASQGNNLTITAFTLPANGTAAQVGDSAFSYSPAQNFFGVDSFYYFIRDQSNATDSARVLITVLPVNDPPRFSGLPDSLSFDSDSSAALNLWEIVEDMETPDSLLIFEFIVSNDSLLSAYNDSSGTLLLSALAGFSGEAELAIRASDPENGTAEDTLNVIVNPVIIVGVEDDLPAGIPREFALQQNYPNPFNPDAAIRYQLPSAAQVRLTVYNILGQKIRTLVNERMEPGYYQAEWDGRDEWGRPQGSGIYIYRLEAGNFRMARKMTLLK